MLNSLGIPSLPANKRALRSAVMFPSSYTSQSVSTGGMADVICSFISMARGKFICIPLCLLPNEDVYWPTTQTGILILPLLCFVQPCYSCVRKN